MALPEFILTATGKLKEDYHRLNTYFSTLKNSWDGHIGGVSDKHSSSAILNDSEQEGETVKNALDNSKSKFDLHISGDDNKHSSEQISYIGSFVGKSDVKAALDEAKKEIDTIVVNASIDPEVALARESSVKGKSFTSLDARLEDIEVDLNQIDNLSTNKIDKTQIKNTLTETATGNVLDAKQGKVLNDKIESHLSYMPINVKQPPLGLIAVVGDGETDDYTALQAIMNFAGNTKGSVYFPCKCLCQTPLKVPDGVSFFGNGVETGITKTSNTTININSTAINSVVVLQGSKISITNMVLEGSIENNVNGITFGENTSRFSFNSLTIRTCKRAFHDFISCWIGEFNKVHCNRCEEAFVLRENISKTSLTFKNCWAENCGQAYDFYRVYYSSAINCAADWCNNRTGNPYGDGGHGSEEEARGIYNLNLCRSFTLLCCGTENSYGNGVVNIRASFVNIIGLVFVNIKSKFQPNYTDYPNYAVAAINIGQEKSTVIINGIYYGQFENTYVASLTPAKPPQPAIAYNYLSGTYGANNKKMIIVTGVSTTITPMFGGQGPIEDCLFIDEMTNNLLIKDYVDVGGVRQFKTIDLTGSSATKLRIPITPNATANRVHLLRIRGFDNTNNNTTPKGFICEVQCCSFANVQSVTVLSATSGVTAAANGSNLEITLGNTYNNLKVECSAISQRVSLIGFLSSTLV